MLVWIIAVLTLGLSGLTGFYAGVVRVGFSLVGLFIAATLAWPLSPLARPLLGVAGVKLSFWQQILAPAVVFVAVMIVVKIAAGIAHARVTLHFKYKRGDDDRVDWLRLSHQLGFCLGLVNGTIYFTLMMIPVQAGGAMVHGFSPSDSDPPLVRFLDRAGSDLRNSRFDRVVARYDPTPAAIYDTADILALIHRNPLSENRVTRYPAFAPIGDRPEFQAIASDLELHTKWQSGGRAAELWTQPRIQDVLANGDLTREIVKAIGDNAVDLRRFIETGMSDKYDAEKILGSWSVDVAGTMAAERGKRPGITSTELSRLKRNILATYTGASLIATIDQRVVLKGAPDPATLQRRIILQGTWKRDTGTYGVTLGKQTGVITLSEDGNKLLLDADGSMISFDREN